MAKLAATTFISEVNGMVTQITVICTVNKNLSLLSFSFTFLNTLAKEKI